MKKNKKYKTKPYRKTNQPINQAKLSTKKEVKPWIFLLLLVILTTIAFAPVLKNEFVNFDDGKLIYENKLVKEGADVPVADFFKKNKHNPHFKPLVFWSWNLEYQLVGDHPFLFHFNNLLLHILNTLLLFFIILKLNKYFLVNKNASRLVAFFIALLFAVHPLHVESVAWASERKDVLYSFFYLFSILLYLKYLEKQKNWPLLIISALLYVLVLMTKSMGITLFAVILLIDLFAKRKLSWKLLAEKIPYLVILVAGLAKYGIFDHFVLQTAGISAGVLGESYTFYPENFDGLSSVYIRFLIINIRIVLWLFHIIIPVQMAAMYPKVEILQSLGPAIHLLPVILLGLLVSAFLLRKKAPWFLFGLLFYLISLFPAIAIGERGISVFLSDRYTYIPALGIIFIFIYFLDRIAERTKQRNLLLISAGLVSFIFIIATNIQAKVWRNSGTLWSKTISVAPDEAGIAYNGRGEYYRLHLKFNKAVDDYTNAIRIDPDFLFPYHNRGKIYFDGGNYDLAFEDYNNVIRLDSNFTEALSNRGAIYHMKGDNQKALEDLDAALELSPNKLQALKNRGVVRLQEGDYEGTISDYKHYLELSPNDHAIINSIGVCYERMQQYEDAIIEFSRAIELAPDLGQYYLNRSVCYSSLKKWDIALEDAIKASELGTALNQQYFNQLMQKQ